jgi:hypothetical protein
MTGWFGIAKRFRDKRTEARVQSLDFESIARRSPDLKDAGAADSVPVWRSVAARKIRREIATARKKRARVFTRAAEWLSSQTVASGNFNNRNSRAFAACANGHITTC